MLCLSSLCSIASCAYMVFQLTLVLKFTVTEKKTTLLLAANNVVEHCQDFVSTITYRQHLV